MPFFSIIIPTYNRAEELKRSLQSVLEQDFADFEVLVVDDGSKDNTRETVAAINDPRIQYIYQANSERSAARNNGIKQAKGKYVCLLDSDDVYYNNHLQVLYDEITADGEQVALYKTMMHYGDSSRPDDLSYAYRGNDRQSAIRYVWNNGSQLICLAFHRDIGERISFPEKFFWFEDVHWIMRVVMDFPLKQVEAHTTKYINKDSANLLKSNFKKYLDNCEACIRDLELLYGNEIKNVLGKNCFDEKVAELYLGFVVNGAIRTNQLKLAKTYLGKAMNIGMTPRLLVKYIYYYLRILKANILP